MEFRTYKCISAFTFLLVVVFSQCLYALPATYDSSYSFDFSTFLEWTGDTSLSPVNSGIYLEDLGNGLTVANLKSASGAGTKSMTYGSYVSIGQSYSARFRAKIDAQSSNSGNAWAMRLVIKDGTYNLVLTFENSGIYYINGNGTRTLLTSAPAIGQWVDYIVDINRGSGTLYVGNNSGIAIPSLTQVDADPLIIVNTRGGSSAVAAQLDALAIIPKRATVLEEMGNIDEWSMASSGSYNITVQNGIPDAFITLSSGNNTDGKLQQNLDISEIYSIRTQFKVNNFGNGGAPFRFVGFNGHIADVRIEQNRDITIRENGATTYVVNDQGRKVILNEKIELEMRISGENGQLWEIKAGGNQLLHTWTVPSNGAIESLRIFTLGSNANVDVYHFTYNDELLVNEANTTAAGEFINFSNGETFGVSEVGGGYGGQLTLTNNGPNIIVGGFGAGWISALRSKMHGDGKYNPTQAGASDAQGAPANLQKITTGGSDLVDVSGVTTPLFVLDSAGYDWIENEPITNADGSTFIDRKNNDGGNSDADTLNERFRTMEDEIRSELDFRGQWEDVSDMASTGNSILRHYAQWDYRRNPDAILQFNEAAGEIYEQYRVADLSPSEYSGSQTPSDVDISMLLNTYSIRLFANQGYTHFMWKENGVWKSLEGNSALTNLGIGGTDPANDPSLNDTALGNVNAISSDITIQVDDGLVIIAKSNNANTADGIGLYIPWANGINRNNTIGTDRATGTREFAEDRRINAFFTIGLRNNRWMTVFTRMWSLGLHAPDNGDPDTFESLRGEYYHIIGSPNEIWSTVQDIK